MAYDNRNTISRLKDLLVQLLSDAVLFIEPSHLAHITGLTGSDLDQWARDLASGHFCELDIGDYIASAPGIHGFAFRQC